MPDTGQAGGPVRSGSVWSRRGALSAGAVAGAATLTGGVAGCSSGSSSGADEKLKKKIDNPSDRFNKKGFPIVDDPITVEFMTSRVSNTAKDFNKVLVWKKYQAMTNIKVKWGLVPQESYTEKRNLALSGGDYPEAFYASIGIRDVAKYGSQGVFIKLNDLIDKYMPHLTKLMAEHDYIKRGLTFPDGNIYSFPQVVSPDFTDLRVNFKLWVRNDWLDKFDMESPATTDEYYQYLKKVKARHPNGPKDTVPFGSSHEMDQLYASLRGSFGIGNRGQTYVDADPDDEDKARFFRISDGYKALLEYLHKLYSEGLIAKNIFSIDQSKAFEAMNKGVYGSTAGIAPYKLRGGAAKHFGPMKTLKGPDGDQEWNNVLPALWRPIAFTMTDKCEHPVEMARWVDYFYSDEGSKFLYMGVEGKSYKETENGVEYLDKIKHPGNNKTEDEALKQYLTYMGTVGPAIMKGEYYKGSETSAEAHKAATLLEPDARQTLKKDWPSFTYTQDEFQKLDSIGADDIEKYVDESRDKFINGDLKLSDWDKYVDKLKKMGLDDYMKIQQAAYDRYRKG